MEVYVVTRFGRGLYTANYLQICTLASGWYHI